MKIKGKNTVQSCVLCSAVTQTLPERGESLRRLCTAVRAAGDGVSAAVTNAIWGYLSESDSYFLSFFFF